MAVFTVKL